MVCGFALFLGILLFACVCVEDGRGRGSRYIYPSKVKWTVVEKLDGRKHGIGLGDSIV
jgi:hypothetical protein